MIDAAVRAGVVWLALAALVGCADTVLLGTSRTGAQAETDAGTPAIDALAGAARPTPEPAKKTLWPAVREGILLISELQSDCDLVAIFGAGANIEGFVLPAPAKLTLQPTTVALRASPLPPFEGTRVGAAVSLAGAAPYPAANGKLLLFDVTLQGKLGPSALQGKGKATTHNVPELACTISGLFAMTWQAPLSAARM